MTAREFERSWVPEPNSGCWLWLGTVGKDGYGKSGSNYRTVRAHRLAWQLYRGPVPEGLCVCHVCDVRSCVNPGHLFLGSNAENMLDMSWKGRAAQGERSAFAKLTQPQVERARAMLNGGARTDDLARLLGINRSTMQRIATGHAWAHAAGPIRRAHRWTSVDAVIEIRRLHAAGVPARDIADHFGIDIKTIYNIRRGRTRSRIAEA
jgi:hypothetical protein